MARAMKVGDTWEPIRGQATDANGTVLDLSTAASLEFVAVLVGGTHEITGAAFALQPPIVDPDGVHFWNWQYNFVVGDTTVAGTYRAYVRVTWVAGEIETFPDDGFETLIIEEL